MRNKGFAMMKALLGAVISIFVGIVLAVNLYPQIHNQIASPTSNTSPYNTGDEALLDLTTLFLAIGIMITPVALVFVVISKYK